ncbi:MAG: gamma-glutamylcyclotransferase [Proteobacteria bacterium]|nr:gamma-glutamylcyclotransferase [Pseudomonadota bacterium]
MHAVFTYGTLQIPAVFQSITGKDFPSNPARLLGYQRYKIKGKMYPGTIKSSNGSIDGTLYRNIDKNTLNLLDEFEDSCYVRCLVEVIVNNETERAFVYIVKDEFKDILSHEMWDLKEFECKYLDRYLSAIS